MISADDPDAAAKIERKIAKLEKLQEVMKAANKIIKKKGADEKKIEALMALGLDEATSRKKLEPDFAGRVGFPAYETTNNLANIKRLQGRLTEVKELQAKAPLHAVYKSLEGDEATVDENRDENRVQIVLPEGPSRKNRKALKQNGWHLTSGGIWQRKITLRALRDAHQIMLQIGFTKVDEHSVHPGGVMVGGLGDASPTEILDPLKLSIGTGVELEHTNDPREAEVYASTHILEDSDYYKKLQSIEGASKGLRRLPEADLQRLIFLLYRGHGEHDGSVAMGRAIKETGIFESQWKATEKAAIADGLANDKKVLVKGDRWVARLVDAGAIPGDLPGLAKKKGKILGHYLWIHPFSQGAMGVEEHQQKLIAILHPSRPRSWNYRPNLPGYVEAPTVDFDVNLEFARATISPCLSRVGQSVEEVAREQDPEGYPKLEQAGYRACWESDCGSAANLGSSDRRDLYDRSNKSYQSAKTCGYNFYAPPRGVEQTTSEHARYADLKKLYDHLLSTRPKEWTYTSSHPRTHIGQVRPLERDKIPSGFRFIGKTTLNGQEYPVVVYPTPQPDALSHSLFLLDGTGEAWAREHLAYDLFRQGFGEEAMRSAQSPSYRWLTNDDAYPGFRSPQSFLQYKYGIGNISSEKDLRDLHYKMSDVFQRFYQAAPAAAAPAPAPEEPKWKFEGMVGSTMSTAPAPAPKTLQQLAAERRAEPATTAPMKTSADLINAMDRAQLAAEDERLSRILRNAFLPMDVEKEARAQLALVKSRIALPGDTKVLRTFTAGSLGEAVLAREAATRIVEPPTPPSVSLAPKSLQQLAAERRAAPAAAPAASTQAIVAAAVEAGVKAGIAAATGASPFSLTPAMAQTRELSLAFDFVRANAASYLTFKNRDLRAKNLEKVKAWAMEQGLDDAKADECAELALSMFVRIPDASMASESLSAPTPDLWSTSPRNWGKAAKKHWIEA